MITPARATTTAAIGTVRRSLRALDLDLPGDLAADLDRLDQAATEAGNAAAPDTTAMGHAALDAVLAGKDPAADKTVSRELLRALAMSNNLGEAIRSAAQDRRAALVAEHGAAVLALLVPVVADIDAVLAEARKVIGPELHHDEPTAVTGWPAERLTAWAHARDALSRLGHVAKVWTSLAGTGLAKVDPATAPLILADLDHVALGAIPSDLGRRDPIAAALHGHRLSLATLDDYRARERKVKADAAAQVARAEAAEDKRTGRTPVAFVALSR